MTHRRQRTGSRPRGGSPVRFAQAVPWMLVIVAALTVSASRPTGSAAAWTIKAPPTVVPEPPRYTLVSLGTLGGETSQALAINAQGDVVGDSSRADGSTHGFLWRNGKMADLGVLPGGDFSSAQGINDRGEIVGVSGVGDGARTAVVWRNGQIRALGALPGGTISIGLAINGAGTVAGVSQSGEGNRAFRWQNGAMHDLGILPGGSFSLARGMNDEGVIVGQADAEDGTVHATRWDKGRIEDLGKITTASGASASSIAYAVAPDGLVVGYGETDSGSLGAVWTGSTPRPVAALTGYAVAQLLALNSFRQSVGDATDSAEDRQIAVIVDLRRVPRSIPALFDLNTLVMNGAGWTISSGKDINDGWEIVGTGRYNGPERAILLRPRPFTVSVGRTGTGAGSITGPPAIACGARCAARLGPGTKLNLRAHPAAGSRFVRWQGACTGTKPVCTRTVDGALEVRAVFAEVPQPCRCVSLSTTASLLGTAPLQGGTTRVRIAIDWSMRCVAGRSGRCEGQLQLEAANADARIVSPADRRVRCDRSCGQGDRVHSGRSDATLEVRQPAAGQSTITLLVHKFCRSGGRLREVGVDRVELTLVPAG